MIPEFKPSLDTPKAKLAAEPPIDIFSFSMSTSSSAPEKRDTFIKKSALHVPSARTSIW